MTDEARGQRDRLTRPLRRALSTTEEMVDTPLLLKLACIGVDQREVGPLLAGLCDGGYAGKVVGDALSVIQETADEHNEPEAQAILSILDWLATGGPEHGADGMKLLVQHLVTLALAEGMVIGAVFVAEESKARRTRASHRPGQHRGGRAR